MPWGVDVHTSPCNFYIFGPFKKALKGHTFTSYGYLHKIVVQWFRQQTKEFFADGVCLICMALQSNAFNDFFCSSKNSYTFALKENK
jgi:hypothetical protein